MQMSLSARPTYANEPCHEVLSSNQPRRPFWTYFLWDPPELPLPTTRHGHTFKAAVLVSLGTPPRLILNPLEVSSSIFTNSHDFVFSVLCTIAFVQNQRNNKKSAAMARLHPPVLSARRRFEYSTSHVSVDSDSLFQATTNLAPAQCSDITNDQLGISGETGHGGANLCVY